MIFTDPPYLKQNLPIYRDLFTEACNVLKPDGILICYIGHMYLPEIFEIAADFNIHFFWPLIIRHTRPNSSRIYTRNISPQYKPMLMFKMDMSTPINYFKDMVDSDLPDKSKHCLLYTSDAADE